MKKCSVKFLIILYLRLKRKKSNFYRSPVTKVKLSEKFLVSVCSDNHVRTWGVTRFRGMISTQPGSTSVSSFKITRLRFVTFRLMYINANVLETSKQTKTETKYGQYSTLAKILHFTLTLANILT
jgi:hypothetical protein